jgi:hypothetical protein
MKLNYILLSFIVLISKLIFSQSLDYGWSDIPALTNDSIATEAISIAIDSSQNKVKVLSFDIKE